MFELRNHDRTAALVAKACVVVAKLHHVQFLGIVAFVTSSFLLGGCSQAPNEAEVHGNANVTSVSEPAKISGPQDRGLEIESVGINASWVDSPKAILRYEIAGFGKTVFTPVVFDGSASIKAVEVLPPSSCGDQLFKPKAVFNHAWSAGQMPNGTRILTINTSLDSILDLALLANIRVNSTGRSYEAGAFLPAAPGGRRGPFAFDEGTFVNRITMGVDPQYSGGKSNGLSLWFQGLNSDEDHPCLFAVNANWVLERAINNGYGISWQHVANVDHLFKAGETQGDASWPTYGMARAFGSLERGNYRMTLTINVEETGDSPSASQIFSIS